MRGTIYKLSLALICFFAIPESAQLLAETIVNNVLSPFSSIKIIGSRPAPKLQWTPDCNKGFTEWKPVCAVTLNRITVTYSNHCMAQLDNAIIIDDRPCPIAMGEVTCAPTYEPVCGRPQHQRPTEDLADALQPPPNKRFLNECYARAGREVRQSKSSPTEFDEEFYGHVTILRKYGDDLFQYSDDRHSRDRHSRDRRSRDRHVRDLRYSYFGQTGIENFADICPKVCPEGGLVVCAVDHNGVPRLYKNRCSAVLAGADPSQYPIGDIKSCK